MHFKGYCMKILSNYDQKNKKKIKALMVTFIIGILALFIFNN